MTVVVHRCPGIESRKYLCGRIAEYRIKGTSWCHIHARRVMYQQDFWVRRLGGVMEEKGS